MAEIPRAVLSESFQKALDGKVLKTGVFLTFRFDPGFFEEEILPVFFDIPQSHEPAVRLVQLEDTLRSQVDHLAVYYDQGALEAGARGAHLQVQRIPIAWRTGYFHPKNVLLLVEDAEEDDAGGKARSLLVATLSANLTRAGWWENVEACHIETLEEGRLSALRDDVHRLVRRLKTETAPGIAHPALDEIRRFLRDVPQRLHATRDGSLEPRLYLGPESVPEFLDETRGRKLRDGLNLEVLSPYFDKDPDTHTLDELIERFAPREVRVYLPRGPGGEALCSEDFHDAVRKHPEAHWGRLPVDLLKSGAAENAAPRRVHAKVYRFFHPHRRYEALFVGSVNLTRPAHSKGGNFETGVLIETDPSRVPEWWLISDRQKPAEFQPEGESDGTAEGPGRALMVRHDWATARADVFWNAGEPSPALRVEAQGSPLFALDPLPAGKWARLPPEDAEALADILKSTSLLSVHAEGEEPATILVQEVGMAHKPGILMNLTVRDILRCWSSLTPEQKAVLLEERYQELKVAASHLMPAAPLGALETESFFDAFAGIFHAFGSLERRVTTALEAGRDGEAVYLLFGQKYDSLPRLIDRLLEREGVTDAVNRYVMLLCARQLLGQLRNEAPDFCATHRRELKEVEARLEAIEQIKEGLSLGSPDEREAFLGWFEKWFLRRAQPAEAEA